MTAPFQTLQEFDAESAQLLHAGAALSAPRRNPDQDGRHYTVVPDGWSVEELPTIAAPARPIGTVKLRDAASFVRYVNDHKLERSRIFASMEPAGFLAVFDEFLTMDEALDNESSQADWRQFRAQFVVPPSREWALWTAANRKHMSQLAFAEFLQDNLPDVAVPSGTDLLELALNFEAAQNGSFVSAQRLQNGDHSLVVKSETAGGSTIKMPELITLRIPVFENEQPRELQARLRYRAKDGVLALWYELVRPHKVLEDAFRDTWARIETETEVVMLLGSPE